MNPEPLPSMVGTLAEPYPEAMTRARANRKVRAYPATGDPRSRHGALFPDWNPKFHIDLGPQTTVFTIGSCFARNIEEALSSHNVRLPTQDFSVPQTEWPFRPNGLLNEYNPGTISQRILLALEGRSHPVDTIVPAPNGFADLLLPGGSDVPFDRAIQRRADIDAVYANLPGADLVVITLGLVEVWFDKETNTYLNRIPPNAFALSKPGRFEFRQLGIAECLSLLLPAFEALTAANARVVLTVSPVPLGLTFSGQDCIVANEYSKSVLRVCAQEISRMPGVDYFPSYEIVRSSGLASFGDDHLHVKDEVVREITRFMTGLLMAGA